MGYAAIVVLLSLTGLLAYMGWRTWPVANTVLAVLLLWGAAGFFYLSARALKTHQAWGQLANQYERDLRGVKDANRKLLDGDPETGTPGIRKLDSRLNELSVKRGRVWSNVTVDKLDPETGAATVTITVPSPSILEPKTVVFAFQQAPAANGGKYVGEFEVVDVKDKTAQLVPVLALTPEEKRELGQGPWTLYATMPSDDPKVYAEFTDAEKKLLPPGRAEELANPRRPIVDFALLFQQIHTERALLRDAIAQLENNIARTEIAIKQTEQDIKARQQEKSKLAADLVKFRNELAVVTNYEKAVAAQNDALRKALANAFAESQQLAAELTVLQLKAAEEIDRRTGPPTAQTRPR